MRQERIMSIKFLDKKMYGNILLMAKSIAKTSSIINFRITESSFIFYTQINTKYNIRYVISRQTNPTSIECHNLIKTAISFDNIFAENLEIFLSLEEILKFEIDMNKRRFTLVSDVTTFSLDFNFCHDSFSEYKNPEENYHFKLNYSHLENMKKSKVDKYTKNSIVFNREKFKFVAGGNKFMGYHVDDNKNFGIDVNGPSFESLVASICARFKNKHNPITNPCVCFSVNQYFFEFFCKAPSFVKSSKKGKKDQNIDAKSNTINNQPLNLICEEKIFFKLSELKENRNDEDKLTTQATIKMSAIRKNNLKILEEFHFETEIDISAANSSEYFQAKDKDFKNLIKEKLDGEAESKLDVSSFYILGSSQNHNINFNSLIVEDMHRINNKADKRYINNINNNNHLINRNFNNSVLIEANIEEEQVDQSHNFNPNVDEVSDRNNQNSNFGGSLNNIKLNDSRLTENNLGYNSTNDNRLIIKKQDMVILPDKSVESYLSSNQEDDSRYHNKMSNNHNNMNNNFSSKGGINYLTNNKINMNCNLISDPSSIQPPIKNNFPIKNPITVTNQQPNNINIKTNIEIGNKNNPNLNQGSINYMDKLVNVLGIGSKSTAILNNQNFASKNFPIQSKQNNQIINQNTRDNLNYNNLHKHENTLILNENHKGGTGSISNANIKSPFYTSLSKIDAERKSNKNDNFISSEINIKNLVKSNIANVNNQNQHNKIVQPFEGNLDKITDKIKKNPITGLPLDSEILTNKIKVEYDSIDILERIKQEEEE